MLANETETIICINVDRRINRHLRYSKFDADKLNHCPEQRVSKLTPGKVRISKWMEALHVTPLLLIPLDELKVVRA